MHQQMPIVEQMRRMHSPLQWESDVTTNDRYNGSFGDVPQASTPDAHHHPRKEEIAFCRNGTEATQRCRCCCCFTVVKEEVDRFVEWGQPAGRGRDLMSMLKLSQTVGLMRKLPSPDFAGQIYYFMRSVVICWKRRCCRNRRVLDHLTKFEQHKRKFVTNGSRVHYLVEYSFVSSIHDCRWMTSGVVAMCFDPGATIV
ncbi:hypothetical protein TNCT_629491 [Trichonephila clavata]|uniref:Uncharacterized protein n=1 Tax=Trichonephila clavata TaxID=2740835 RepID=A0A8X6KIG1_TRICU|nr:hypothetical protein TNCT_629491 [Trichonephila clavata]